MLSVTEENYLKAIYKIAEREGYPVNTNPLALAMQTTAASVTDMVRRLSDKQLLRYEKYKGVELTPEGDLLAIHLIRRHRLWEVFLHQTLGFSWDAVHDIAEELEHIQHPELTERLDQFLGNPQFDPHGDPIPDAEGQWNARKRMSLAQLAPDTPAVMAGVADHSSSFLQYLHQLQLLPGATLTVRRRVEYDQSVQIMLNGHTEIILSDKVARNVLVSVQ